MSQFSMLEQIASENNLKNAWIKVIYHAHTALEYFDKYAYDEFEENLDLNLAIIRQQLLNQTYRFDKLRIFEIPKGDDRRKVYFLSPKDGIVSQAMLNILAPIFEQQFSTRSFGNRISYASNESKNPFLDWHDQYIKYVNGVLSTLELPPSYWYQITDIANYYPSVDKTKLIAKIALKVHDAGVLHLLEELLNLAAINLSEQLETVPGLPPGTVYSHFFANLYLDDFDKYIEQYAENYARYVDDMCFVVKSEDALLELNKRISSFFGDMGNLFLKEKKTESHPVSDTIYLIEHTRKLKYDLRFGVIETLRNSLEFNEIQVTEKIFHDLFLRVEKEEDISKIVEDAAGFIAAGFGKLSIDSQLAINIAYGLLSKKPQRVTAIRALLGYLMEFSVTNSNQRFIEFIKDSPDIIKISFLQLLLGYSEVHNQIFELLIALKDQNENYLVKANVYVVLERLQYGFSANEFSRLVATEKSDYIFARLIQCVSYNKQNENTWAELRQVLEKTSNLTLNAVIFVSHKINYQNDDWVGTKILLPVLLSHSESNLFSLAFSLRLVSLFGDYDSLRQVHNDLEKKDRDIAEILFKLSWTNVFVYLAKRKNDYGRLFVYLDSLKRLNIDIDYFAGYQEILINSTEDALLGSTKSITDQSTSSTLFPKWYGEKLLQIDKGLYCEFLVQPNYSSRLFQDGDLRGVLEIMPVDVVLASQEFSSVKEWLDYLKDLDNKKVVKLIDAGVFKDNGTEKIFAAYEIESGFSSVREWLSSDTVSLNENSVLDIMVRTTEKMEKTKLSSGFYFQNVNPCTVLWNPQGDGDIRLLNIGAALLLPKYVCGSKSCNKKYHDDEVGKTTGSYFLGLLAVQIITKDECPVIALDLTKDYQKKYNFFDNNGITPHLKSIIARMVQRPSHRYDDLDTLKKDLIHAFDFVKKRSSLVKDKSRLIEKLTLVDFLDFRLGIAERSPDVPNDPLQRANWVLERLSDQIIYYSDQETINSLFTQNTKMPFVNLWTWYWLSPEGRTLLRLAFDWDNLVNLLNEKLGFKYSNKFSNMLFGRVIYFEALATIQGLLTFSSLSKENAKSFARRLLEATKNEKFAELRIKARYDNYSQPLPNPYANEDLNPITNLFQIMEEKGWIYVLRRLSAKLIFSGINFARHEIDFFSANESLVFTTSPLIKTNKSSSKTWLIHKLPFIFLTKLSANPDISINSTWEDAIKIIKYLHSMNPCKRKRGMLIDYNAIPVPPEGSISFGWNWISWNPIEANFAEDTVLTLGNLLILRGNPRAIQIDFVNKSRRISSIFSYSKIFENLTSSSKISFESTIAYVMKKHKWIAWILILILALFQYIQSAPDYWKVPTIKQLLPSILITVVGRLVIDPIWKKVEEQLAIIRPEDKILEIRP